MSHDTWNPIYEYKKHSNNEPVEYSDESGFSFDVGSPTPNVGFKRRGIDC